MGVKHDFVELDGVESQIVRAGIDYWRGLKGGRCFPTPRRGLPREIGHLLRHAALVKVIDSGEEYEFRIFGDAHTKATSLNMQGSQLRDLSRISPSIAASWRRLYDTVRATRQPFALRALRDDCPGDKPLIASENVLLPLGRSEACVDHILVFSEYAHPSPTGSVPISARHSITV